MPQNIFFISILLLYLPLPSLWAQLSFFGDLYVGSDKEIHIAFDKTYFNGGQVITARGEQQGVVSFGENSQWTQLKQNSFVDGIVRIYHIGNFNFPIGEDKLFSPITLFLQKNETYIEVQYQKFNDFVYPNISVDFTPPSNSLLAMENE